MAASVALARKLLHEWTVARYLATRPPSHVVTVTADDSTVGEALAALNRHGILSAPLVAENGDVIGVVSIRDVLAAFLAGVYPGLLRGADSSAESLGDELAAAGAEFCEGRLRVLGSAWDITLVYKARCRIATLLELVARGFFGSKAPHHRTAVWDLDGTDSKGDTAMRVTAVVSQTDVVRFLHRHVVDLGELAAMSLGALGLDRKQVVMVPATTSALAAFAAMLAAGVSAVGITAAADGPLVANLSVSDLRGLTSDGWGALAQPVATFLLQKNGEVATAAELSERQVLVGRVSAESGGAAQEPDTIVPLHSVRPSTTFGELLAKFDARGVHHMWVLDDDQRPLGIVTPTDVLKVLQHRAASVPTVCFACPFSLRLR